MIIKELFGYSDDEIVENLMLDLHLQYALHTTTFEEQPLSDKTLRRFRKRCYDYERPHNADLYRGCVRDLSQKIAKVMGINGRIRRMDSMMIEANIRFLSRMELIYTCISKVCAYLAKEHPELLAENLKPYADPNDFNRTFYQKRNEVLEDKIHRGYVANIEESVGASGSVVTDYRYEQNTHSDSQFLQESIAEAEISTDTVTLITDGSYGGGDNTELAREKNIDLVTTALIGKDAPDVLADFQFSEDGTKLEKCAVGHPPEKCYYTKTTKQVTVIFAAEHCKDCPYRDQCNPRIKNGKVKFTTSMNASNHAKHGRRRGKEDSLKNCPVESSVGSSFSEAKEQH